MPDPKPSQESDLSPNSTIKSEEATKPNTDQPTANMETEENLSTDKEAVSHEESSKTQDERGRIQESKSQFKIGRSVSLTRADPASSQPRGLTPSPKPKVREEKKSSVRDRKARFEDLYRNHRSVKEITKGKRNNKNSRQHSPEPEKEDLSSILKEMRAGFKDIRGDLAKTNT